MHPIVCFSLLGHYQLLNIARRNGINFYVKMGDCELNRDAPLFIIYANPKQLYVSFRDQKVQAQK